MSFTRTQGNYFRTQTCSNEFSYILRLCLEDAKVWHLLKQRRNSILETMIPGMFSPFESGTHSSYVWVDGVELRRFLSCKRYGGLENGTRGSLCGHKNPGLHPRVARRGKVLPKDVYDAYELLRCKEIGSGETKTKTISPSNMRCTECSEDYRRELSKQLDLIRIAKRLYNALDPKVDTFSLQCGADEVVTEDSDWYAFIIFRPFATHFRRGVESVMKQASAIDETKRLDDMKSSNLSTETLAEGLDALDLSILKKNPVSDRHEVLVNEAVTCK